MKLDPLKTYESSTDCDGTRVALRIHGNALEVQYHNRATDDHGSIIIARIVRNRAVPTGAIRRKNNTLDQVRTLAVLHADAELLAGRVPREWASTSLP